MKNILLSGSDPGGFQTIIPLIDPLRQEGHSISLIVGGAAVKICADKSLEFIDGDKLTPEELREKVAAIKPDIFISGTSGGYAIDKKILPIIKELGAPSLYVLDFWSNYWQRFSSEKGKDFAFLPDTICVLDQYCKDEMVKEGFAAEIIKITGNPHFDHFADAITTTSEETNTVLFVSQPIREQNEKKTSIIYPFDEYVALQDLVDAVAAFPDVRISVRLHPRENVGKFDELMSKHPSQISLSKESSLEAALSKASCIVGMFSPVLLQAKLASKSVLSYQPGGAATDPLITNKLGITKLVDSKESLVQSMAELHKNDFQDASKEAFSWPKDATKRVIEVIDFLI